MKKWELFLGRPRSPKPALYFVGVASVLVGVTIGFEKMGYVIHPVWSRIVIGMFEAAVLSMPATLSLYGTLSTVLLLTPVFFLFPFDSRPEESIWFWCMTSVTTVLAAIGIMRSFRVRKLYQR